MNFFDNQDKARRKTVWLVLGFILSIVMIVLLIDWAILSFVTDPVLFQHIGYINLGIASIIFLGSVYKYTKLRAGGKSIVAMLDATPIDRTVNDPKYRQLINVVDEIAIASGIAAPMLYVLSKEQGINAFVAGYNPNDTVLVVTEGTLDNLSRDELQGVIAHEYSHIFNSDTTLNLRILIVLSGLFMLSQIGYLIMRTRSDRNGSVVIIGLALYVLGYLGVLFGNILRAAISRQRESLADASAVQYTRNPQGITMALLKIKQQGAAALMQNKHAEDVNHMCFSKARSISITDLFATHPKLEKRIAALDPDGTITAEFLAVGSKPAETRLITKSKNTAAIGKNFITGAAAIIGPQIVASIGNPSEASIDHAQQILSEVPDALKKMLATIDDAQALMYAMIMAISTKADYSVLNTTDDIKQKIAYCLSFAELTDHGCRATLLELAIPTLKKMDDASIDLFLKNIYALGTVDKQLNVFKAIIMTILTQRLNTNAFKNVRPQFTNFKDVQTEISCILWFLAMQGSAANEQRSAYAAAIKSLDPTFKLGLDDQSFSVNDLVNSLTRLRLIMPALKEQFLHACIVCIMQDEQVQIDEVALLRAICSCLDCPAPLL